MSETNEQMSAAHAHAGHGHAEAEADRANVGALAVLFALMAISLAIISYLLWIYFQREAETLTYQVVLSRQSPELQQLRAAEEEWLSTWGVVDAQKGRYRMPIDEAKDRFLKQAAARRAEGRPQAVLSAAPATEGTPQQGEAAAP